MTPGTSFYRLQRLRNQLAGAFFISPEELFKQLNLAVGKCQIRVDVYPDPGTNVPARTTFQFDVHKVELVEGVENTILISCTFRLCRDCDKGEWRRHDNQKQTPFLGKLNMHVTRKGELRHPQFSLMFSEQGILISNRVVTVMLPGHPDYLTKKELGRIL